MATSAGLHQFDGRLPNYSPPALKRRKAEIRRHLRAIDLLAQQELPSALRLEVGVLRGMLLTERFKLEAQREPQTLPSYFLLDRKSVV